MYNDDRSVRVIGERLEVVDVTGEDNGLDDGIGERRDDGIGRRDGARSSRRCPQGGGCPSHRFRHVPDLAGTQQSVGVEVAPMIPGQNFRKHHRGNLRGPHPSAAQLGQAGPLHGQSGDSSGIKNEGHAAPDRESGSVFPVS